ncbi:hypothetical protein C2E23DRAFT_598120 [Lenzites betulinus]|nr:hypothetical protein C2E23DRAFT_598120 [Lenzites betulinus]
MRAQWGPGRTPREGSAGVVLRRRLDPAYPPPSVVTLRLARHSNGSLSAGGPGARWLGCPRTLAQSAICTPIATGCQHATAHRTLRPQAAIYRRPSDLVPQRSVAHTRGLWPAVRRPRPSGIYESQNNEQNTSSTGRSALGVMRYVSPRRDRAPAGFVRRPKPNVWQVCERCRLWPV